MAKIEMNLEKSLALCGNESAPNDIRAIGALSAAALLLHGLAGSCPAGTFGTIESVIGHLCDVMVGMDETDDDSEPEAVNG